MRLVAAGGKRILPGVVIRANPFIRLLDRLRQNKTSFEFVAAGGKRLLPGFVFQLNVFN